MHLRQTLPHAAAHPQALAIAAQLGLAPGRRALAVFAHPDDEAWAAALTLRSLADAGVDVHLLCATAGEAGGAPAEAPADVARIRKAELSLSASLIGCCSVIHLERTDGALEGDTSLVALLTRHLERIAPDALLSLGDDGGYPHRDHIALVGALIEALGRTGCTAPLWQAVYAPGTFGPLLRRLRRGAPGLLAAAWPDERLGSGPADADVVVMAADRGAHKLAAIACHRSQLRGGGPERLLGPGVIARVLAAERWRRRPPETAVGEAAGRPPGAA